MMNICKFTVTDNFDNLMKIKDLLVITFDNIIKQNE